MLRPFPALALFFLHFGAPALLPLTPQQGFPCPQQASQPPGGFLAGDAPVTARGATPASHSRSFLAVARRLHSSASPPAAVTVAAKGDSPLDGSREEHPAGADPVASVGDRSGAREAEKGENEGEGGDCEEGASQLIPVSRRRPSTVARVRG